jgi:predicted neuraminidase
VSLSYCTTEPVKEFVYDKAPFSAAHASTLVELRNGDLMAAWFGGTKEGAPDVAIWGSTHSDRGWSPPIELARENEIATYNPVLFHTGRQIVAVLQVRFSSHQLDRRPML